MLVILYQSAWPLGGGTSFTAHLTSALRMQRVEHTVWRIGKRTENFERRVGAYGFAYRNMAFQDVLHWLKKDRGKMLMTMGDPDMDENYWIELAKFSNFWCVFHDPNEFPQFTHWNHFSRERAIAIREYTHKRHMPTATYIPHPYVRISYPWAVSEERTRLACSIARVCSMKQSHWILAANEALPMKKRVDLLGSWHRLWWFRYVKPRWPNTVPSSGYPRVWGLAARLCERYKLMVDLSVFKDDGGDTQYTLLEAMDGGAVPVMSEAWVSYPGPARKLGFSVADSVALTKFLRNPPSEEQLAEFRERNTRRLEQRHSPTVVVPAYLRAVGLA